MIGEHENPDGKTGEEHQPHQHRPQPGPEGRRSALDAPDAAGLHDGRRQGADGGGVVGILGDGGIERQGLGPAAAHDVGVEMLAGLALVVADAHGGDIGRIDPDRAAVLADDPQPAGTQGDGGPLARHALALQRAGADGVEAGFGGAHGWQSTAVFAGSAPLRGAFCLRQRAGEQEERHGVARSQQRSRQRFPR